MCKKKESQRNPLFCLLYYFAPRLSRIPACRVSTQPAGVTPACQMLLLAKNDQDKLAQEPIHPQRSFMLLGCYHRRAKMSDICEANARLENEETQI